MRTDISRKVVIIVDAASSLGAAVARDLCYKGVKVVAGCIFKHSHEVRRLIHALRWEDGQIVGVTDIDRYTNPLEELVNMAVHHYGRVDAIVNYPTMNFFSPDGITHTGPCLPAALNMQANLYNLAAALTYTCTAKHARIISVIFGDDDMHLRNSTLTGVSKRVHDELQSYGVLTTELRVKASSSTLIRDRDEVSRIQQNASGCVPPHIRACIGAIAFVIAQPDKVRVETICLIAPCDDADAKLTAECQTE